MKDKKKKPLFYNPEKANNTHVTILAVIGAYMIYMAYNVVQNTKNGNSSMSMSTTIIAAALLSVFGVICFAYATYVYLQMKKYEKEQPAEDVSTTEEVESAEHAEIENVEEVTAEDVIPEEDKETQNIQ